MSPIESQEPKGDQSEQEKPPKTTQIKIMKNKNPAVTVLIDPEGLLTTLRAKLTSQGKFVFTLADGYEISSDAEGTTTIASILSDDKIINIKTEEAPTRPTREVKATPVGLDQPPAADVPPEDHEKLDNTVKQLMKEGGTPEFTKNLINIFNQSPEDQQALVVNNLMGQSLQLPKRALPTLQLRDDGTIERNSTGALQFEGVTLAHPAVTLSAFKNLAYSKFERDWKNEVVGTATWGGGIPQVVDMKGSYTHATTDHHYREDVEVLLEAGQFVPKVELQFRKLHLSKETVDDIRQAVNANSVAKLLDALNKHGHLCPTKITLGGKFFKRAHTKSTKSQDDSMVLDEFKQAVDASVVIEGVPVDAQAGGGFKQKREAWERKYGGSVDETIEVVGGDPATTAGGMIDKSKWIGSLGPAECWRVISYDVRDPSNKIVSTIDLLDDELKNKCKTMLKKYFEEEILYADSTPYLGKEKQKPAKFADDIKDVAKIKTIKVFHPKTPGWIHGIQVQWKMKDGALKWSDRHGTKVVEDQFTSFSLEEDEEITSIEVTWGDVVDSLVFHTSLGRRFPEGSGTIGNSPRANGATITAPSTRILGFVGRSGWYLDDLGVRYLAAKDRPGKHFLLAVADRL